MTNTPRIAFQAAGDHARDAAGGLFLGMGYAMLGQYGDLLNLVQLETIPRLSAIACALTFAEPADDADDVLAAIPKVRAAVSRTIETLNSLPETPGGKHVDVKSMRAVIMGLEDVAAHASSSLESGRRLAVDALRATLQTLIEHPLLVFAVPESSETSETPPADVPADVVPARIETAIMPGARSAGRIEGRVILP